MTFLVILFFCGLSAAVVAKIKGSSFFLWFLIGFCLPIIGTVAAVLHRSERSEPRRACEECGKVLPMYVQVCTRCGRDLDPPELTALTTS